MRKSFSHNMPILRTVQNGPNTPMQSHYHITTRRASLSLVIQIQSARVNV
jgi:hypothetical protein